MDIWEDILKPRTSPTMDDGASAASESAPAHFAVVEGYQGPGEPFNMAWFFLFPTHNYEIPVLARAVRPEARLLQARRISSGPRLMRMCCLSVTPPPQICLQTMEGRHDFRATPWVKPWNQQAVFSRGSACRLNQPDYDIVKNNPEKVFGITAGWAEENPKHHAWP